MVRQAATCGKVGSLLHGFLPEPPVSPTGPPAWVRFDADGLQRWGMTEGRAQDSEYHHAWRRKCWFKAQLRKKDLFLPVFSCRVVGLVSSPGLHVRGKAEVLQARDVCMLKSPTAPGKCCFFCRNSTMSIQIPLLMVIAVAVVFLLFI